MNNNYKYPVYLKIISTFFIVFILILNVPIIIFIKSIIFKTATLIFSLFLLFLYIDFIIISSATITFKEDSIYYVSVFKTLKIKFDDIIKIKRSLVNNKIILISKNKKKISIIPFILNFNTFYIYLFKQLPHLNKSLKIRTLPLSLKLKNQSSKILWFIISIFIFILYLFIVYYYYKKSGLFFLGYSFISFFVFFYLLQSIIKYIFFQPKMIIFKKDKIQFLNIFTKVMKSINKEDLKNISLNVKKKVFLFNISLTLLLNDNKKTITISDDMLDSSIIDIYNLIYSEYLFEENNKENKK